MTDTPERTAPAAGFEPPLNLAGARILVTLMHALKARGLKKGLATLDDLSGKYKIVQLEC